MIQRSRSLSMWWSEWSPVCNDWTAFASSVSPPGLARHPQHSDQFTFWIHIFYRFSFCGYFFPWSGQIQKKTLLMVDLNLFLNTLCSLRFLGLGWAFQSFQNEDRSKIFICHPKFQGGVSLLYFHVPYRLSHLINHVSFFCQKSINFSVNLLINSLLSYNL